MTLERHKYDVLVIGAGGAGLRAAVEARESGLRVAIICKSLFGKAHTNQLERLLSRQRNASTYFQRYLLDWNKR